MIRTLLLPFLAHASALVCLAYLCSTAYPCSIKTGISMQPQALDVTIDEPKLVKILPLYWLKARVTPRAR